MNLSLVVPCYNEEENVKKFFDEVNKVFSKNGIKDYEFVFVNDGSSDKTYQNLKKLYDENNEQYNIKVLTFSRNFGKESAMYAGLSKASGDFGCIIDADLQQRPEVVVEMMGYLNEDDDLDCITAYQDQRKEGKVLSFFKSTFYKLINKISDVQFVNGASDFRLMRRKMVDAILQMTEYHRFSKGLFSYVGFNTKYIPYEVAERASGESKWNFSKLFKYALEGIFAFSTVPLKISIYAGFISSVASLLYLIFVIFQKLIAGINIPGYATIVVLLLFIGGLQLFCLGLLGEYISKMYVQVKDRPIYILKEYLHNDENDK